MSDLERRGLTKLGAFDLREFRRRAEAIEWSTIPGAPRVVQSGDRSSAYYIRNQRRVFVSNQLPQEALVSQAQLELHEALGATGFNDDDYAMSSALVMLHQLDPRDAAQLQGHFGRSLFRGEALEAGGTSVSGGGDLAMIFLKDQVLGQVLSEKRRGLTKDFLSQFPFVVFEPLVDSRLSQVHLKLQVRARADARGRSETLSVLVPMRVWREGGKAREELVQDIATKLTDVYQAFGDQTTVRFQPSTCASSGKSLTVPRPRDMAAAQIQTARVPLLLGCEQMAAGMTDLVILAPLISDTQSPREAGTFYFSCRFRYGAGEMTRRKVAMVGQGILLSDSIDLPTGETVFAELSVDRSGAATGASLVIVGRNELRPALSVRSRASSATFAKVNSEWREFPLVFECQRDR